jgi:hypothetical protein
MGPRTLANQTRGQLYTILAKKKKLSPFCPCPKTLWEAGFKGDGVTNLEEEISKVYRIQAASQDKAFFWPGTLPPATSLPPSSEPS